MMIRTRLVATLSILSLALGGCDERAAVLQEDGGGVPAGDFSWGDRGVRMTCQEAGVDYDGDRLSDREEGCATGRDSST